MSTTIKLLSLGELESLVLKAVRGAGYSWGLSQEAGRAAAWLARHGLPAAEAFAKLLPIIDSQPAKALGPQIIKGQWLSVSSPLCPVVTGTAMSDFGWPGIGGCVDQPIELTQVACPIILVPFLSGCAVAAGRSLSIVSASGQLTVDREGQLVSGGVFGDDQYATVHIVESGASVPDTNSAFKLRRRASVAAVEMQILEAMAHRTYVPASEQSRSGAGAGLSDND